MRWTRKPGPEVAREPVRAELVADEVGLPEDVAPAAREARGVERGLDLRQALVIEVVAHQRLRRGGPPRAGAEVLGDEAAVGAKLEVARPLGHRRFDDLVADHEQQVARAGARAAAVDAQSGVCAGRSAPPGPGAGR